MTNGDLSASRVFCHRSLLLSLTASVQSRQSPLSPLPAHVREHATVHILNPDMGFDVARKGTNGFHALLLEPGTRDEGVLTLARLCKIKHVWCLATSKTH